MADLPIRAILILTGKPMHAKHDKMALARMKPEKIHVLASGVKALELLRNYSVPLVLLDSELEDMPGLEFMRRLRQVPELRQTMVIMVTAEARRDRVLDSISAGVGGYILRPYSIATFERHIRLAQRTEMFTEIEQEQVREGRELVEAGAFDEAIESFEELVTEQDESHRYYDMGMRYLMDGKYGKAIVAFKKAVQINDLFAEAYKGLAEAYKGKGETAAHARYLQKAAEVYAQLDKLEETKELFIQILKYENKTPNPFNTLGVKLRRQGDYRGAVHAYRRAIELTPDNEALYFNLARAFLFMGDREQAEKHALQALIMRGEFPEALDLYEEITGRRFERRASDEQAPSPVDRMQELDNGD
ncbi:tetratricopeptide repeat protein [Megalodesulfovibrio gigas]|uniref:Putative response regulator receiver n=1 Tax=Megalodesulfovibrio gigas (strain ATCC 19364 / DSM 1382 / NCIMB 9332 / VKM B-1759) TaxID=1121448 RepID=T2GFQ6_MEGG1|nr:tetratricopeptide repeat protein [Megalodesulfovibrio gigas]AGW14981.1 putative response regulator receiver [Megalodesulfovibrio gigas DSM 1382 = ATCC 19364]